MTEVSSFFARRFTQIAITLLIYGISVLLWARPFFGYPGQWCKPWLYGQKHFLFSCSPFYIVTACLVAGLVALALKKERAAFLLGFAPGVLMLFYFTVLGIFRITKGI